MRKRAFTKVMACVLAVLMLVGVMPLASASAEALPEKAEGYNRYYFYMPDEWYNDYATTAGIYWWEGTDACTAWPGYEANKTDTEDVYYYDVPQDVTVIMWNNYLDGGLDSDAEIYTAEYKTSVILSEYYDAGESYFYPNGTDSFDGMIYVIDLDKTEVNEWSGKSFFAGEWYYYYGNGEYGFAKDKENAVEVFTGNTNSLSDVRRVASLEVAEGSVTCVENYDGSFRNVYNDEIEDYERYFHYDYDLSEFVFEVTYSDGTSEYIGWYDETDEGYEVYADDNQSDDHWAIGGENLITFEFLDATAQISVQIVENPVESIEIAEGSVTCIENYDGYYDEYYNDETGEWEEYFNYWYDLSDVVVKVNYKDGTSEKLGYYDVNEDGYVVCSDDNQSVTPWVIGGENLIVIELLGAEAEIPVQIVENPVASIEVVEGAVTCIENYDGYYDEYYNDETDEWEEHFHYWYSLSDVVVKVNYKDGTSEKLGYYDVNEDGYVVCSDDNQSFTPWTKGGENPIILSFLGVTTQISAQIVDNPVSSLEVIKGEVVCYENAGGEYYEHYNEETDEWEEYFYYEYDLSDFRFRVNYKDGTSEELDYFDTTEEGYEVYSDDNQSITPWIMGGENLITFDFLGATAVVKAEIIENPVERIELIGGTSRTYTFNTDGYFNYNYNEESDTYERYFHYNTDYPYDAEICIYYKDSSTRIANVGDEIIPGYSVDWYHGQYDTPWVVGENDTCITYMGVETILPITVEESDVKSISVTGVEKVEIAEETNGRWESEYDSEASDYTEYYFYDIDELLGSVEDAEIKVEYKDSSIQTVSICDEDVIVDYEGQYYNHWTPDKENSLTVNYKGGMTELPVIIIPNTEDDTPDATEPTDPSEPTEPTEPSDPTEPSEPIEPPVVPDGTTPTDTTDATEPTEVTEPTEATEDEPATEDESVPATEDESTAPTEPESMGVLGDATGDGKVNIKDVTLIQKQAAKLLVLSDEEHHRADVNLDLTVNIKDATAIQKHLAKYDTGYAIGLDIKF